MAPISTDHISSSLAKAGMKKKILQLSRNESSLQVGKKGLTDVEENVYETKCLQYGIKSLFLKRFAMLVSD